MTTIIKKIIRNFNFAILISVIIIVPACTNKLEEINALTQKEDLPDMKVKNLVTHYTANGELKVVLETPTAYKYLKKNDGFTLFPEGLNLTFYDANRKIHSKLSAKYGIYEDKKKIAHVKDSVVLTNVNGSVLETEELYFDEASEKIYSIKLVKITDKYGFSIQGAGGFESNIDFTVYRFTDVTGFIIQQEKKELQE